MYDESVPTTERYSAGFAEGLREWKADFETLLANCVAYNAESEGSFFLCTLAVELKKEAHFYADCILGRKQLLGETDEGDHMGRDI